MLKELKKTFKDRQALTAYLKEKTDWLKENQVSDFIGGRKAALKQLQNCQISQYAKSRNYLDGAVTRLSPYITHGLITLNEVRNYALSQAKPGSIEKFIQELTWRDYWQNYAMAHPELLWHDAEPYKTGFQASAYADQLPDDIATGKTPSAAINYLITELYQTGYLHNHARMYLASYLIHFRRIKWQVGASWFLALLIDGDVASNNFSWQWVASTFSNRPYIFNLENLAKYASDKIDVSQENNQPLAKSYEQLRQILFPNL